MREIDREARVVELAIVIYHAAGEMLGLDVRQLLDDFFTSEKIAMVRARGDRRVRHKLEPER